MSRGGGRRAELVKGLERNPRYVAVMLLKSILQGRSLADQLPLQVEPLAEGERRFVQHLIFGTLRHYDELNDRVGQLLKKPLKRTEIEVKLALILAAYELTEMATAEHALVNNWVNLIKGLKKPWAVGLTNAILRRVQREGLPQARTVAGQYNLPQWIVDKVRSNWGEAALESISTFYRLHPEMILRVNQQQMSREEYLQRLASEGIMATAHKFIATAIVLETPTAVDHLPEFFTGAVSVQDASAQLAAEILAPAEGDYLLDACAAPGGKTTALLEANPKIGHLVALDSVEHRLKLVADNLTRLYGALPERVTLQSLPCQAYQGGPFDKILLDVPCSATGIMHRYPDIKRLRKPSDIQALVAEQRAILNHAWGLLKPGGLLLYATCSILKEENSDQIAHFLAEHPDAKEHPLSYPFGVETPHGLQILPQFFSSEESLDGFYYALLERSVA